MYEDVERIKSDLLDRIDSAAFPMTLSQLAAIAEEEQVGTEFFERIPERSFSSKEEVVAELERASGESGSSSDPSSFSDSGSSSSSDSDLS